MLERIDGFGRGPAAENQLSGFELGEPGIELRIVLVRDRTQQHVGEFAADDRAHLRDLLCRPEPVEPRHQRILERRRDRQARQAAGHPVAAAGALFEDAHLQHRARQLLDEQRDAVGPRRDLRDQLGRDRAASDHLGDHVLDVGLLEPSELQRRQIRRAHPRQREFVAECQNEQQAKLVGQPDREPEQLERGRIGPMQILDDADHRRLGAQALQALDQRGKRIAPQLLRCPVERRIVSVGGDRQQVRKQRHECRRLQIAAPEQRFELAQPLVVAIAGAELRRPLQLRDDRIERAGAMMRRALIAQPDVRLRRDPLIEEMRRKPRLADAGLAANQHDLALAAPGPLLALGQALEFMLAADEPGEARGAVGFEAARERRWTLHHRDFDRLAESLDRTRAEFAQLKQIAEQPARRGRDDDGAGFGEGLHPRRKVRRLANHLEPARSALCDEIADDDEPGRNPDPHLEPQTRLHVDGLDRGGDLEPGANRALGIVLVSGWIAEIGQDAVAHQSRDDAVIARDDRGRGLAIGLQDLAHLLRIELL
jgi:hypothetical protein